MGIKELAAAVSSDISTIQRFVLEDLKGDREEPISCTSENSFLRAIACGITKAMNQHGISDKDALYDLLSRQCELGFIILDPASKTTYFNRLIYSISERALIDLSQPKFLDNKIVAGVISDAKLFTHGLLDEIFI